jgi:hypothetical protein
MNLDVGCSRKSWFLLEIQVNLDIEYFLIDRCLVDIGFDSLMRLGLFLVTLFDKLLLIGNNQVKSLKQLSNAYALGVVNFEHFSQQSDELVAEIELTH